MQDSCVLDYTSGIFVKLDLGFVPSPSGGGLSLLQAEEVHDMFVLLHGYTPDLDTPDRREATALVTVMGLIQSVFGYPNEEAYWLDSRGRLGHGFYEVQGSGWHANILEYNRRTNGSRVSDLADAGEVRVSAPILSAPRTTRPSSWLRAYGWSRSPTGPTVK